MEKQISLLLYSSRHIYIKAKQNTKLNGNLIKRVCSFQGRKGVREKHNPFHFPIWIIAQGEQRI